MINANSILWKVGGLSLGLILSGFQALGWELINKTDPINDSLTSYIVTFAQDASACSDRRPGLLLGCSSLFPPSLYVGRACAPLIVSENPSAPFAVTLRVDDNPSTETTMRVNWLAPELIGDPDISQQDQGAPSPDFGSFIKQYLDSETIALRYFSDTGGIETLVFPTSGLREIAFSTDSACDSSKF